MSARSQETAVDQEGAEGEADTEDQLGWPERLDGGGEAVSSKVFLYGTAECPVGGYF